jgi:hypothetical protein
MPRTMTLVYEPTITDHGTHLRLALGSEGPGLVAVHTDVLQQHVDMVNDLRARLTAATSLASGLVVGPDDHLVLSIPSVPAAHLAVIRRQLHEHAPAIEGRIVVVADAEMAVIQAARPEPVETDATGH